MKKTLLASSIALIISSTSANSFAEDEFYETEEMHNISTAKEGATIGTTSIIGGALGGPIGLMAGSIGGSLMASELMKADEYELAIIEAEASAKALHNAEITINALKEQLYAAQQQKVEQAKLANLELQVLFHTGNDTIDEKNAARLDELALFLQSNNELNVYLHGHTDPRGTDEYNNVLSMHRTINVEEALASRGIDLSRIKRRAYGSEKSQASKGNLDEYALERRVSIEIFNPKNRHHISMIQ